MDSRLTVGFWFRSAATRCWPDFMLRYRSDFRLPKPASTMTRSNGFQQAVAAYRLFRKDPTKDCRDCAPFGTPLQGDVVPAGSWAISKTR